MPREQRRDKQSRKRKEKQRRKSFRPQAGAKPFSEFVPQSRIGVALKVMNALIEDRTVGSIFAELSGKREKQELSLQRVQKLRADPRTIELFRTNLDYIEQQLRELQALERQTPEQQREFLRKFVPLGIDYQRKMRETLFRDNNRDMDVKYAIGIALINCKGKTGSSAYRKIIAGGKKQLMHWQKLKQVCEELRIVLSAKNREFVDRQITYHQNALNGLLTVRNLSPQERQAIMEYARKKGEM
ncbi:MAG: hypothetical protein V1777_03440 [Candidatus Micrarchaeota archaeon]